MEKKDSTQTIKDRLNEYLSSMNSNVNTTNLNKYKDSKKKQLYKATDLLALLMFSIITGVQLDKWCNTKPLCIIIMVFISFFSFFLKIFTVR